MEELFDKNPRIEVVDALRGFAVLAILLVHSLEHFIYPVRVYFILYSVFLPEKPMPSLPFYSDSHSIFRQTTRKRQAKTSAIVSCGGCFSWLALRQ